MLRDFLVDLGGTMNEQPVCGPLDSYASGLAFITQHGGELVSRRPNTRGGTITTYRVRFDDGDVLLTWGLGGVITNSGVELPDRWRVVVGRAKR